MSDTQDGHELRKLIRALVVEYSTAYLSHEGAQKIIELCRAHFQRQEEPVGWRLNADEITLCHSKAVLSEKHDGTDPSFTTLLAREIQDEISRKLQTHSTTPDMVPVPITKLKEIEWEAGHYNGCGYWVRTPP